MKKKSCHRRRTKVVHRSRKNVRRTIKRKSVGKGRRRPTRRYSRVQRGGIDMKLLKSSVNSVCFSPDSKSIAVGSDDGFLRVFNVDSGKEIIRSFRYNDVSSVSFSTDNNNIAIGAKNFLWIFDIDNVRDIMEKESLPNYYVLAGRDIGNPGSNVKSVCFSPDGKTIAAGGSDTLLHVFDADNGKQILEPIAHEGIVKSVCFSPDGKSIATGSYDKFLRVFDAGNGNQILEPIKHEGMIMSVCFSPDGKSIATGSSDMFLRVFDAGNGMQILEPIKHEGSVNSVCFSTDGKSIAIGLDTNGEGNNTLYVYKPNLLNMGGW